MFEKINKDFKSLFTLLHINNKSAKYALNNLHINSKLVHNYKIIVLITLYKIYTFMKMTKYW